ncbi:ubiquitin-like-conjugating enzyme ATG10 isoform X3 [Leptonychotes weddellii]|uniref:Ubiquitin-like-conjugating enzyme ATG10 n=1 Tax=Leptonychotes weddellii TaxID=9713 RepID=A0A7F8R0V2_LEPWE|nr:ubiquitin-like-conjugating enzyme ATG10 isoform X3 [Leptonychotes weddellii]
MENFEGTLTSLLFLKHTGETLDKHSCLEPLNGLAPRYTPSLFQDCSEGYMCKTYFQIKPGTVVSHLGTSAHVQTCLPTEEALELPLDDFEVTETTTGSEVIKYEYHVLYSCSYQVPVLYFRASFLDGRPLALKDIWEGIHECYKTQMLQEPWDTITQQDGKDLDILKTDRKEPTEREDIGRRELKEQSPRKAGGDGGTRDDSSFLTEVIKNKIWLWIQMYF